MRPPRRTPRRRLAEQSGSRDHPEHGLGPSAVTVLARTLSILGHPALVMPLVAAAALAARDRPTLAGSAVTFAVAAAVMMFSWLQVRRGDWGHVDAVRPHERRSLNRATMAVLAVAAVASALSGAGRLSVGLAAALAIVAAAALTARWFKLSQHVAFGVLASVIAWQVGEWLTAAIALLTLGVAWSRLALKRHDRLEVLGGAIAGLAAGLLLTWIGASLPG